MSVRTLYHIGCGQAQREDTPLYFQAPHWKHVRIDASNEHKPDIISLLPELKEVTERCDVIYSSHVLEHLHPVHGYQAIQRFHQLLNTGGSLVIKVPDILEAMKLAIEHGTTEHVVYQSPAGPITVHDMLYGFNQYTLNNPYMRHQCAFTPSLLTRILLEIGFTGITVYRASYNLEVWATKSMV